MTNIRKAIIPAAGIGSRFKPISDVIPKEMFPIIDKPVLEYIINEAIAAGFSDIYVVTNPNKDSIPKYFKNINIIYQDEPKGLGHAIMCAKDYIGNEPFAVLLGDDLIDGNAMIELKEIYETTNNSVIGIQEVDPTTASRYGIVEFDNTFKVRNIIEKPENPPTNYAILGRYIFTPKIFDLIGEIGKNGEIQLTDAISKLLEYESVYACKFHDNYYDIGSKDGFIKAVIDFSIKKENLKIKEYMRSKI